MTEFKVENIYVKGLVGAKGISIGKVLVYERDVIDHPYYCSLHEDEVDKEVERFLSALDESRKELKRVKKKLSKDARGREHTHILDAHLMILKDTMLIDDTINIIKSDQVNAEWALKSVLQNLVKFFDNIDDDYLRQRSFDIEHIVNSILLNLTGRKQARIEDIDEPVIVIAHDLSPSDTAQMIKGNVLAFATNIGGTASHASIIARSFEIPAIVGLDNITQKVIGGETVIIDAIEGYVIINPSADVLEEYQNKKETFTDSLKSLDYFKDLEAVTKDNVTVDLLGNMEIFEEVSALRENGAQGIGLYRSEFLYLTGDSLPTEKEHDDAYVKIAKEFSGKPVTIRTLDIGADKLKEGLSVEGELNPALGLRAVRLSLKKQEVFKTQLKGILRASATQNINILFPMISGVQEIRDVKDVLKVAKEELRRENYDFDEDIKIGIMIEVPSAVIMASELAKEVDFFSIGTNDLLQYTVAIDRVNDHVAYLYDFYHPALLRMIETVAKAARENNIGLSVCGETAGEAGHALMFIGFGITKLSMNAYSMLKVKKLVRNITSEFARDIAKEVTSFKTGLEVERFLEEKLKEITEENILN